MSDTEILSAVAADPQAMDSVIKFAALEIALAIWILLYLFYFSNINAFLISLILNMVSILQIESMVCHFQFRCSSVSSNVITNEFGCCRSQLML